MILLRKSISLFTTYSGPELMRSSALGLEKNLIPPLLTDAAMGRLTSSYLGSMRGNCTTRQEKEDWCSNKDPEMVFVGFFQQYNQLAKMQSQLL